MSIIQHTNTPAVTLTNYGARLSMELGFCQPIEFDTQHNHYALVIIKHFSKWLELVRLPDRNNKGVAYAFLDKMFNRFGALTEVLINQGTKF
jgi:hypothetical protein